MKLLQTIRLSLNGIVSNRLRSLLTMLGVIIGVSAVITLVSIGQGTSQEVSGQIQGMGSNLVTLTITAPGPGAALTIEEALELNSLPGVAAVTPSVSGAIRAVNGQTEFQGQMQGTGPDYPSVQSYEVAGGRFFTSVEVQLGTPVAVLGYDTALELFGLLDPLGEELIIAGQTFRVIGVLAEKESSLSDTADEQVVVPVTAALRVLQQDGIRSVSLQGESPEAVDQVVNALEAKMETRFRDEHFRVFSQQQILDLVNEITGLLSLMIGGIAGISLLVGGIGIMNIMLVTVTERTREIGLRKALGARPSDIMGQFLIEAMIIGGLGGLIGILVGVGGSRLLQAALDIPTAVTLKVVILAFSFSLGVGLFFGIYPARRASGLNPIDALRHE